MVWFNPVDFLKKESGSEELCDKYARVYCLKLLIHFVILKFLQKTYTEFSDFFVNLINQKFFKITQITSSYPVS